jgi:hypothetical protein
MSGDSQFYADNEADAVAPAEIDLTIAHTIQPNAVSEEEWPDQKIIFFCHDCEKVVDVTKSKKKIKFICKECGNQNTSFGTEKSVMNFFRINEAGERKK